jgi:hypothetical protein
MDGAGGKKFPPVIFMLINLFTNSPPASIITFDFGETNHTEAVQPVEKNKTMAAKSKAKKPAAKKPAAKKKK